MAVAQDVWLVGEEQRIEAAKAAWEADEKNRLSAVEAAWKTQSRGKIVGQARKLAPASKRSRAPLALAALGGLAGVGALTYFLLVPSVLDLLAPAPEAESVEPAPVAVAPVELAPVEAPEISLYVKSRLANVRAEASRDSAVVTRLKLNASVNEIERRDGWVRVRVADEPGTEGWVHGSLLAVANAEAAP